MRNQPRGRSGRTLRIIVLGGVVALAFAACGGSAGAAATPATAADPTDAAQAADPADAQPASGGPEATDAVTTVEVGQEAWFAGFHLTFGTATAELRPDQGGTVTIATTFENTGEDGARLDATLDLTSAGEPATADDFGMDIPSVPGLQTAKGTLAFRVADSFTFDDAVLTLGLASNQQAVVPLTATAGEAVTLEPVPVTLAGSGNAGDLKLDLTDAEVRADSPWKHGQQDDGSLILTVGYAATFTSGFAGGFAFTGENVALKLPDGTTVGVIQDGQSQSLELIGPKSTVKDQFSRFEIADPAAGQYALLVRSFDNAEDEIPFSLP
jgi:hypothetical protein